jgi:putative IMPACT (imprinted ancient) family translation regulator
MTQLGFSFSDTKTPKDDTPIILQDVIVDRKSHYTVIAKKVDTDEEVWVFMKSLLTDAYFRKATHNSSAYRILTPEWATLERKNDDGETWAGMCILRELQRANATNTLIVVTRYFWGIHLGTDRFKNVLEATKKILEQF